MSSFPPGELNVYLTGYWPFQGGLSAAERLMEGGVTDRKSNPLHTFEDHRDDPANHPYCSCAGDYTLWSYGQLISLPTFGTPSDDWKAITGEENYLFRVVDTGGHFFGPGKVYRQPGYEPIDVCVDSSQSASTNGVKMGPNIANVIDESLLRKGLNAVGLPGASDTSGALGLVLLAAGGTWLAYKAGLFRGVIA